MTEKRNKAAVRERLSALTAFCKENGLRLTDPRLHVYAIIVQEGRPVTAYEVLEKLGAYLDDPKPPTAYRAIEFLAEHGFVHRIESLNAYVACETDHRHNGSQFLVCDSCGAVSEAHLCHLPPDLAAQTDKAGFALTRWSAELHGLCKACRK